MATLVMGGSVSITSPYSVAVLCLTSLSGNLSGCTAAAPVHTYEQSPGSDTCSDLQKATFLFDNLMTS